MEFQRNRWLILFAYMFVAAVSQLIWLNFAPITTPVMVSIFKVSEENVGWLSASWPLVFILFSIPAGMIADRKGFKYAVLLGSFIISIFSLLRLVTDSDFAFLLIFQSLAGIGQPFIYVVISILVVELFPENERTLATGLAILAQLIGLASALIFTPLLVPEINFWDFQIMLLIYGLISLISLIIFYISSLGYKNTEVKQILYPNITILREFFRNRDLRILLILFFIGIGFFTGLLTWLESALVARGISITDSGLIAGLIIIGGIFGSFLITYLSGKLGRKKVFFIFNFLISAIMLLIITFSIDFFILAFSSFLLGFFLIPSLPLALDYSSEIVDKSITGTVQSILWLGGQAGAVVIIPVMGFLEDSAITWNPFLYSLIFVIFLDLVALILSYFLKVK